MLKKLLSFQIVFGFDIHEHILAFIENKVQMLPKLSAPQFIASTKDKNQVATQDKILKFPLGFFYQHDELLVDELAQAFRYTRWKKICSKACFFHASDRVMPAEGLVFIPYLFFMADLWQLFLKEILQISWLQRLPVGLGVAKVLFAKANKIWLYPAGIASISLSAFTFFEAALYAEFC
jgi:hypothetical protein